LEGEMKTHLEEQRAEAAPMSPKNRRNGHRRPSRVSLAKRRLPFLVTERVNLSRRSSRKGRPGLTGLMTRSCRYTSGA
jgi:hypothetical protein